MDRSENAMQPQVRIEESNYATDIHVRDLCVIEVCDSSHAAICIEVGTDGKGGVTYKFVSLENAIVYNFGNNKNALVAHRARKLNQFSKITLVQER